MHLHFGTTAKCSYIPDTWSMSNGQIEELISPEPRGRIIFLWGFLSLNKVLKVDKPSLSSPMGVVAHI